MKRHHFVGVSMARRVDVVRPRELRDVLEHTQPDDPPRRLSGAGLVVIGCIVASTVFYVLGFFAARLWGHS